jgi:hypothetical protein
MSVMDWVKALWPLALWFLFLGTAVAFMMGREQRGPKE